jgi:hypothetical protein
MQDYSAAKKPGESAMTNTMRKSWATVWMIFAILLVIPEAMKADVVTDWNSRANDVVAAAKLPTPMANRVMAMVQTAVYEAVNAITKRYPGGQVKIDAPKGASVEAAVAAANRSMLLNLLSSQRELIESDYRQAISSVPDGQARTSGIAVGEQAAAAVLAMRSDDSVVSSETYRPHAAPGVYVPTVVPMLPQWPQRKPWVMTSADQFRPSPPPSLNSELWARDYNESKSLGGKSSVRRTAEQTEVARFWEATGPALYFPVVKAVTDSPGRDLTQNARLLAVIGQAMDDAIIAVFDAKYYYNFWRPITAIRNGDKDGNDATERDPSWAPFIETPMHPEYPCAHCISAATVAAVLRAEIGTGAVPQFSTSSVTAPGVVHRWTKLDDFVREVSEARICDGVHFRNSTEVANAMGKKIGELAAAKALRPK